MHCVDLGESFPTSTYLQNFVSIRPRTSPVKFAARRGAASAGSEAGRARSCTLRTKPLLDYEAWSQKETFSVRERTILNALQTLVVVEDFCLPAECDLVESDRTALLFAFSERYL